MLLEALIAAGILAGVLSIAVQGLAAGSRAVGTVRDLTAAQNLARSQMASVINEAYCVPPCDYQAIAVPSGYTVTAQAQTFPGADTSLAYVVVTVYKGGQPLAQVKQLRANR